MMLFTVLLINTFIFANAQSLADKKEIIKASDYVFDTPDVVKEYVRTDGTKVRLYAYRTKNNDRLLERQEYKGLRWVSLGKPEIVKLDNSASLFNTQNKLSFSFHFEMLTQQDGEVLADEVHRAKNFSVDPAQFSDIDSNTIECSIELYDLKEQKTVLLKGKVFNMNQSPYKIDFKYPIGTQERSLFEEEIKSKLIDLEFRCSVTAGTQIQKSNTFTITLQESSNIRLDEKLFGPANEVYVSRDQLTELSNEVYSYFNIIEDYQIPQDQFGFDFVENLISLTGESTFKSESFENALASLSKYSLDIEGDLKTDQIKNEVSKLFKIDKTGGKSHIVFDDKYYDELDKQSKSSGRGGGSFNFFKIFGAKGSGSYANDHKEHWIKNETHLDDQLKEFNNYSKDLIEYTFNGDKIIPKTINVCKLKSSAFKKKLSFSRIKNVYYEADFNNKFTLSTIKYTTKVVRQYPNYSIVMLGSEKQLRFFDENGKGFDEMTGWYLCDGRNGSPDLRGRVANGRDPKRSDYRIGAQGGNEQVKLSIDQMPHHTHLGINLFSSKFIFITN